MKTLLLTLVVVTIVCLDLGYTRKCLNCSTRYCTTFHTCPNGQDLCFKRWYEGNQLGWRAIRGCAATCPEAKTRETVECCATDKCNK
uniref:Three-finger toxin n=2 Tax=Naja atra TaxID=8656 RepID=E2ITZ2_NAJAT|nr:three-finger toxin precursor [Naja atra]